MALPAVTPNSPVAGSIAWAAFTIQYQGVGYAIGAGNTAERWVWWRYNTGGGTTIIEAGPQIPDDLKDDDLVLLGNKNGLPIRVQSTSYVDGELLVDGTILATALGVDSVTAQAIKAGAVGADEVDTNVLIVNDVYARDGVHIEDGSGASIDIHSDTGFLQTDELGAARVNFPVDPAQPNVLRSELITDGITAEGRVSLRGIDNEISRNSVLKMAVGTTAPATSPSIATGVQTVFTGGPSGVHGLLRDGTSWKLLVGSNSAIATIYNRTDAGVLTTVPITGLPAAITGMPQNGDICKIGTNYYVVGYATVGGSYNIPQVITLDANMAYVRHWTMPMPGNFSQPYTTLATDGTNLYTAAFNLNGSQTAVYRVNLTTGAVAATVVLDQAYGYIATTKLLVGNFDFGSLRYIIYSTTNPTVFSSTGVTTTEGWTGAGSGDSWSWDGTRFFRYNGTSLTRASTNKAARTIMAAYTWYDSDPVGGNFETTISPVATFVQPARMAVSISTPPPADDGSSNAPDTAKAYVGLSAVTLKLQGSPFLNQMTMLDPNPATGAAPPGVNTFPDGVAGSLQSTTGGFIAQGDGRGAWPYIMPPGAVLPYAGASVPQGFLEANGQLVSRTVYAALFTAIGTLHGAGDGSTTFALPDFRGRTAVGQNTADTDFDTVGESGGSKTVTMAITNMPAHNHGGSSGSSSVDATFATNGASTNPAGSARIYRAGTDNQGAQTISASAHNHTIPSQGSGTPMPNLQPYEVVKYIIKT